MEVKTIVPSGTPRIMLISESPGETELKCGKPFVGNDGKTLRSMLTQAGIYYGDCIIANLTTTKIPRLYMDRQMMEPTPEFYEQLQRLKQEIEELNPNILVPLGSIPLWAICGEKKIKSFRGTVLESTLVPGKKVIPTLHPKAVNYDWKQYYHVVMDFKKVQNQALTPDIPVDNRKFSIAPGFAEARDYLDFLLHEDSIDNPIAIDLEHVTPGAHISWFGISHTENFAMSINFIQNRVPCFPENDEVTLWTKIAKLLSSPKPQIYHNAGYDVMNLLHNQGVHCNNVYFDTFLASHVMWPEFPRDLGFLSSIFLMVPAWKHTGGKQYEHGAYNAADACNTRALYNHLKPLIDNDIHFKATFELEMRELQPAGFMQLQGMLINKDEQDRLCKEASAEMQKIEEGLSTILKKNINFNSSQQMQQLLYMDLGYPTQYKRRKSANEPRKVTCDAEAIENLYIKYQDPVLKLILSHRKLSKMLQFINVEVSSEQRVHTSYNIGGTTTGRWSSSKSIILDYGSGNLQNIDRRVRSMYVPPPGYGLLQADYKGAEAHVVAHLIQDHKIIQCFNEGGDVHKRTAAFMFGIAEEDVTKEQRTIGKKVRHATNYSAGPKVLAKELGIPLPQAKTYLANFHHTTPQLHIWHESIKEQLAKDRTLITPLGRKRVFMDRWGDQLFRSAFAFIPQSTIGDLLNISMCCFYEKYKTEMDMGVQLQLHDAIYLWCREEEKELWAKRLYEQMRRPIPLPHIDLLIGVDFKFDYSWGSMKSLEVEIAND